MKKLLFFISLYLFLPFMVNAKNTIYSIDMDIYLNKDGSANIEEKWDVKGSDGTEWYKAINGIYSVDNFTVKMDDNLLKYKNWNVNESLSQKKGYYGINNTNSGIELCFGKYDFNRHVFTLNYKIEKFIYNTNDSQYIYWNLIDRLSNVNFEKFSVTVSSYYDFPDTLDVWGYGHKGYTYVNSGKIGMSNSDDTNMNESYVVLLVKFPLETFISNNVDSRYQTFNDVLNKAKEGSFEYDYEEKVSKIQNFLSVMRTLISVIIPIGIIGIIAKAFSANKYGYKNNKKIDLKNIPNFREIPCNKDIYYANVLLCLNKIKYKETNILGAIILKWVKENKVKFSTQETKILKKEESVIDLTLNPTFENKVETELFNYMYDASKDGILEKKEFEKWCRNHYNKFFTFFSNITDNDIKKLENNGYIYKRTDKSECKYKKVMNDKLFDDSVKLYGLYNYLEEFAGLKEKQVLEVKEWDEYLMFAYLFGNADKVASQLKNMYPEVLQELNYDYDTFIYINSFSTSSVSAASSARSAAQSYSAGGGGFSSGGGGGGSFGGGGGGSR